MKKTITQLLAALLLIGIGTAAQAQEKESSEKTKRNTKITVISNNKRIELDNHLEDLGDNIGDAIEQFVESFNFESRDNGFSFSFDSDFDFEKLGEDIERSVNAMVNNMEIEMEDVDPRDFRDNNFDYNNKKVSGEDILREIEKSHGSKVENIDKLNIKIRKEKVFVDMEMTLENGDVVRKKMEQNRD